MADKTKYFDYDTIKEMLYDLEFEGKEVEPSDYPYIEIADEHGRCIDADELYKTVDSMNKCSMNKVLEYILDAPTILEANR